MSESEVIRTIEEVKAQEAIEEGGDLEETETKEDVEVTVRPRRRKFRRFTQDEDIRILEAYRKPRGDKRDFLRSLADELERPFTSVEKRYYYLMAKQKYSKVKGRVEEFAGKGKGMAWEGKTPSDEELVRELITLPERVARIEQRISGMIDLKEFVDRLAAMHDSFEREQELIADLAAKDREIAALKAEFSKHAERIQQREEELNEIYTLLENTLSQWMKLSAIDKFKVMGDFALKVETVVDKFGNVIRRRPIVVGR